MKHKSAMYLFILTLVIGLTYQMLPYTPLSDSVLSIIGTVWNVILAFGAGYFLLRRTFFGTIQAFSFHCFIMGCAFRHFDWCVLFLYLCRYFWTTHNKLDQRDYHRPNGLFTSTLHAHGEELLSTNLLLALQKKGLSFFWSSVICSVLFALWHIPAYGFHPAQLLITLMPARLALNYVWKKSNSVWVSWICHFLYDSLGFISFLGK